MPNLFRHPTGHSRLLVFACQVTNLHGADLYLADLACEVLKQVQHDMFF
jgi:hypothetical protein